MHAQIRNLFVLVIAGVIAPSASAQELSRAEITKRIKAATAYVQVVPRGEGSAFCIHESGLFLTNEQVVRKANQIRLVLYSSPVTQEVVTATVLRVDVERDLAILKMDQKVTCTPLPLGSSDGLLEQTEVTAAGFPITALKKGEYPPISISVGKISALRLKNGELQRIQLDATVISGNSGGPVVDATGKVVGICVRDTANFAIPVNHIHRFISVPEVEVQTPSIAYVDRFKATPFQVKTAALLPAKVPYQVELILGPTGGAGRSIAMKLDKDVYRAVAEPLAKPKGPAMLKISLTYPTGNLSGIAPDRSFKVGSDEVKLTAVRIVRFGANTTVVLTDDKVIQGPLTGLDELALQLGSDVMKLNPAKAVELAVAPAEPDDSVEYTVIVRSAGKEVARLRDSLAFLDAPAASAKASSDPIKQAQKLDGFWVVERTESKGNRSWPRSPEEAIYIEDNKVQWVKKDGLFPPTVPEADFEVVAGKNPRQLTLSLRGGPADGQKWQVIYRIEGDLLTIATDCAEDRCPSLFTVRTTPGSAQFVRTYRRVME